MSAEPLARPRRSSTNPSSISRRYLRRRFPRPQPSLRRKNDFPAACGLEAVSRPRFQSPDRKGGGQRHPLPCGRGSEKEHLEYLFVGKRKEHRLLSTVPIERDH